MTNAKPRPTALIASRAQLPTRAGDFELVGFWNDADGRDHVALVRGDMTSLPCRAGSFDLVLCRSALHHMEDEVGVLSEIRRVLAPGGSLVLGE